MADFRRKRRHLRLPIWSSVVLASLNITLMVVLIVQLAQQNAWPALTLGAIALGISLFAISFYSVLTIKEIQLNRRQSNFVDSVTHELKTPIAALRLYLDTLRMRDLNETDRNEFYGTMTTELERLDQLINQLLEVGRLDALGSQTDPEHVDLSQLLMRCAEAACKHHKCDPADVFDFDLAPIAMHSRRMVLEMIFGNVIDNAVKYGGDPPRVHIKSMARGRDRVVVRIRDEGNGIPDELRTRIFGMFFRGSDELQRTRKGTGLGLYIVKTLVGMQKGRVTVADAPVGNGSVFEVTLPGRAVVAQTDLAPATAAPATVQQPTERKSSGEESDETVGAARQ